MSTNLSLREALARQGEPKAERPASSGSLDSFALAATGEIDRPVDVARLIVSYGRSLKKAHSVLRRLASGDRVCLDLRASNGRDLERRFEALGIAAVPIIRPHVSVAEVRRRLDLTQAEFALRFGFEPETVRNWEQGRNSPDPAMQVFLAVIEQSPHVVDQVMSPALTTPPGNSGVAPS